VEARYAGPNMTARAVSGLAGTNANCLTYGVTNHYLDVTGGGFAMAPMGSPRLRLRVYECGAFRFGQLEHKRQVSPERTEKDAWPAEQAWDLLLGAMPWLEEEEFRAPPPGHPHSVLIAAPSQRAPLFGKLVYVRSLRYRRVSCASGGLRVTADSDFDPAIVPVGTAIVETKGAAELSADALEALGLQPLMLSKFALLSAMEA
jgi:hypothetical protein